MRENIDWLETSLEYFETKVAKRTLLVEDKKEVKNIVDTIRKDLTSIANEVNAIAIIKPDK